MGGSAIFVERLYPDSDEYVEVCPMNPFKYLQSAKSKVMSWFNRHAMPLNCGIRRFACLGNTERYMSEPINIPSAPRLHKNAKKPARSDWSCTRSIMQGTEQVRGICISS